MRLDSSPGPRYNRIVHQVTAQPEMVNLGGGSHFRFAQMPLLLLHPGRLSGMNRREPAIAVRFRPVDHSEEFPLQLLRHRSAPSLTDLNAIDGTDRRNFGRRAGEKY